MTAQDLLDYTFHQLDEPNRDAFERALSADAELALRASRLGRSIARLLDDGDEVEPPAGLAARTVAVVERRKGRPQAGDFAPSRAPFRMADFAVAATVFFAAILTLSVPILRSRMQMDQAACSLNLNKLGVSLASYKTSHNGYPLVPAKMLVGTYGVMLQHARVLSDPSILSCPSAAKAGAGASALPAFEKFCELAKDSPDACRDIVHGHFAYNVGYRRPSGEAACMAASAGSAMPAAADAPGWSDDGGVLDGNSPNHGGRGQNVLYCDGHVRWSRNRWVSRHDSDLYLNEAKRPAAGLHAEDSAVMPSALPAWGQ